MNDYYNLILEVCKHFTSEEWTNCKEDESIFPDWEIPYEIVQQHLKLTDEEFEEFRKTDEFNFEWVDFCDAERLLIKENTNDL